MDRGTASVPLPPTMDMANSNKELGVDVSSFTVYEISCFSSNYLGLDGIIAIYIYIKLN